VGTYFAGMKIKHPHSKRELPSRIIAKTNKNQDIAKLKMSSSVVPQAMVG
jgi:hypothetical protein